RLPLAVGNVETRSPACIVLNRLSKPRNGGAYSQSPGYRERDAVQCDGSRTRRHTQFPPHRRWLCAQCASQSFPRAAFRPDDRANESMTACTTNRQTSFYVWRYAWGESASLPDQQNGKNLLLISKAALSPCCPYLQFPGTRQVLAGCNVQA